MDNKPKLSQLWNDVAIKCRKTAIFINDVDYGPRARQFENYFVSDYVNYLAEAIAMLVRDDFLIMRQYKIMKKHRAGLETVTNKQNKYVALAGYDAAEL
jgi:hypothetical protein